MDLKHSFPYLTDEEIERLEQVIARFIKESKVSKVSQTMVYKALAYVDNYFTVKKGRPLFLLEYKAMERGPVPIDLYSSLRVEDLHTKLLDSFKEEDKVYVSLKNPRYKFREEIFSPSELRLLGDLFVFLPKFASAKDMSDSSHEDIAAWRKAWKNKKNDAKSADMSWEDTFDLKYNKKFQEYLSKLSEEELELRKEMCEEQEVILKLRKEVSRNDGE